MATIRSQLQLTDGMSSVLTKVNSALLTVLNSFEAMQSVAGNAINVTNIENARAGLVSANQAVEAMENNLRATTDAQDRFNGSIRSGSSATNTLLNKIKGIAAAAGAGLGIQKLIALSDQMSGARARLNLIVDDGGSVAALEEKIMASANRSRSSYLDTMQSVSKLGLLAGDAFSGNDEVIKFAELMNKNFVIAGASASEQANSMYQLNQAMAAGKLQGDEYRSIIENAPLLAQSIEDYMVNVQHASGSMKDWAAQGQLTADVIKNALFASAGEVEERFNQLPMTWGQVWTVCQNMLLEVFDPLIQLIGAGAQFVYDNWAVIEPIFWGLAAAVGAYALITGIQTAATWLSVAANQALIMTLLTSPITWIALGVGVLVMMIYKWVQSVGGLKIAWLIACNVILTAWDMVKIGVITGVYGVMNMWDKLSLATSLVGMAIANYMGDMKTSVLVTLQNMVNGAIGIINSFINALNAIPGVNIELVKGVTFGAAAQIKNEAEKAARAANFMEKSKTVGENIAQRTAELTEMKSEALAATVARSAEISAAQSVAKAGAGGGAIEGLEQLVGNTGAAADNAGRAADSAGRTADAVGGAKEDLKYMRDLAERDVINRFTTAEVKIDMTGMTNRIDSGMDLDGVISRLSSGFADALSVAAEGVHS